MNINTYLIFSGNCEEALQFYAQCLGGKISFLSRFRETPAASSVAPEQLDKIIHASLQIGDTVLMASDGMDSKGQAAPSGFSLSINTETPEEAERIFALLAEGGKVTMPLTPTFWATRFGMLNDRFGTPWMVNCEGSGEKAAPPDSTPASVK